MGIPATQSSVSRDLSEIGAVRIRGQWMVIGMHDVGVFEGVAQHVTEVRFAGPNLTLLRTQPGAGTLVAQAIDASEWDEVVGTVAGLNSARPLPRRLLPEAPLHPAPGLPARHAQRDRGGRPIPGNPLAGFPEIYATDLLKERLRALGSRIAP